MNWTLILGCVILIFLIGIITSFITKKMNRAVLFQSETNTENKASSLVAEYEFVVTGLQLNAERTSKSRQELLEELDKALDYDLEDGIISIEREPNNSNNPNAIVVLNRKKEDLGYLSKEDQNKLLPYLDNKDYNVITDIAKLASNDDVYNLMIISIEIFKK